MQGKKLMKINVRAYQAADVAVMNEIWNAVVEDGMAFPQTDGMNEAEGTVFYAAQTYCAVAQDEESGEIVGMYILHPNNIGRCGHLANASFAVRESARGAHVGEKLVRDCLKQAGERGFRVLQFNAVVNSNTGARHLYEKLGFVRLGTVPGGFRNKNDEYEDIILYYHTL